MNYYIADLHLGHANAIRFDNRPFADVDEAQALRLAAALEQGSSHPLARAILDKAGDMQLPQVNGFRGDTSIQGRIEHDLYYIENWTLLFDIKILFMTVFRFSNSEKLG